MKKSNGYLSITIVLGLVWFGNCFFLKLKDCPPLVVAIFSASLLAVICFNYFTLIALADEKKSKKEVLWTAGDSCIVSGCLAMILVLMFAGLVMTTRSVVYKNSMYGSGGLLIISLFLASKTIKVPPQEIR